MDFVVITTLKLDPQRKHFAQLVARSRGITFAALVDELLDVCLDAATLPDNGRDVPVRELMKTLWGEHEADRIAQLGSRMPELLTERERVLWERIVCESQCFWRVLITGDPIAMSEETFNFPLWREAMSIYDGMSRNEMLVEANRFSKARATIPNWYTDKASVEAIRNREAKFAARAEALDKKAGK